MQNRSALEPPPRRIRPISKIHPTKRARRERAVSPAAHVRLVPIRPADARPDKGEQLGEKREPGAGLVRAATAAAREFVERGVRGGEHRRVCGDRDHAKGNV